MLDQFMRELLNEFLATSGNNLQGTDPKRFALQFSDSLVDMTRIFLEDERRCKLDINWNHPDEEQELLRRTGALGDEYYLAPQGERRSVIKNHLAYFAHLPMLLEEIALEKRVMQLMMASEQWKDTPIETRRMFIKVSKTFRPIRGMLIDP